MAAVDDLFAELSPTGKQKYAEYVLTRTPPALQAGMLSLVNTALAGPFVPSATVAQVAHGASVIVQDNGGGVNAKSPGIANVTLSTLNYARLAA